MMKMMKRKNLKIQLKKGEAITSVLQPSVANRIQYQRLMLLLINAMHKSVIAAIKSKYQNHKSRIANDERPAEAFKKLISSLRKQWEGRFGDKSQTITEQFINGVLKHNENAFRRMLKKEDLEFKFKPNQHLKDVMQAAAEENVGLIKSIPSQYFDQINTLVMDTVLQGSNLNELSTELTKRYNITRKRAEFIAADQNDKLSAVINRTRCEEIGINEAIWVHSPRRENARPSHLEANGKRFSLSEGMELDGKQTWPGQEINCHCTFKPIIPINNNASRIPDKVKQET